MGFSDTANGTRFVGADLVSARIYNNNYATDFRDIIGQTQGLPLRLCPIMFNLAIGTPSVRPLHKRYRRHVT